MKKSTNNLHESGQIMNIVNYLFGVRFFEYLPSHLRKCGTFFYIIILWTAYANYTYNKKLDFEEITIIDVAYVLIDAMVKISITCLGCYYSKLYLIFNQKLKNADESVRKLGVPKAKHEICKTYVFFFAWSLPLFIAGSYTFQFELDVDEEITYYTAIYSAFLNIYQVQFETIVFLDFAVCVRNMKKGFDKVNYLLKEVITEYGLEISDDQNVNRPDAKILRRKIRSNLVTSGSHSPIFVSSGEIREKDEKMKNLLVLSRLIHLELSTASKMLYMMFEMQLNIQLQLGSIYIAQFLVMLYEYLLDIVDVNSGFFWATIIDTLAIFFLCLRIAWVSYLCEGTSQEGKKTLELIYTCSSAEGIDSETMDEIRQFSLQITQMNYGPSKMNSYFQMNYNFLRKYVLNIITYVFIMIEISDYL